MKLYNIDHSPYTTRLRMQIRKKGLPVDICPPPLALRTPEFFARFPLRKVPVLELDDGRILAESTVIAEYLEQCFPDNPQRPEDAYERGQMNEMTRFADTHLGPNGVFALFRALINPQNQDFDTALENLKGELTKFENLLNHHPDFHQRPLHLGDFALVPVVHYVLLLATELKIDNPLPGYPKVLEWWHWAQADAVVKAASDEMETAFKASISSLKG